MAKKPYYLYSMPAEEWTLECEANYNYSAICGDTVYYIASTKEKRKTVPVPEQLIPWIQQCEIDILAKNTETTRKKAQKKLMQDLHNNLEEALAAFKAQESA